MVNLYSVFDLDSFYLNPFRIKMGKERDSQMSEMDTLSQHNSLPHRLDDREKLYIGENINSGRIHLT